jgi:hypothetical protein
MFDTRTTKYRDGWVNSCYSGSLIESNVMARRRVDNWSSAFSWLFLIDYKPIWFSSCVKLKFKSLEIPLYVRLYHCLFEIMIDAHDEFNGRFIVLKDLPNPKSQFHQDWKPVQSYSAVYVLSSSRWFSWRTLAALVDAAPLVDYLFFGLCYPGHEELVNVPSPAWLDLGIGSCSNPWFHFLWQVCFFPYSVEFTREFAFHDLDWGQYP